MNKTKLIALDLDGTLLDSQKRLSPKNRKALETCIEQGIYVVPCTGRIWFGVPDFIRELPGIEYAITINGAVIEDVARRKVLDERKMSPELTLQVLEMAEDFHAMYDVYIDGKAFGEERFMNNLDAYAISPHIQTMIRNTRTPVKDVIAQVRQMNTDAEKVNYFFSDPKERTRAKEALSKIDGLVISSSVPENLEINGTGAAKGEAILRLAKHLGIKPEETMGFGDGENDMNMIRLAGTGVAMGNAIDELKEIADYVTITNDEDGVADALEKLGVIK